MWKTVTLIYTGWEWKNDIATLGSQFGNSPNDSINNYTRVSHDLAFLFAQMFIADCS